MRIIRCFEEIFVAQKTKFDTHLHVAKRFTPGAGRELRLDVSVLFILDLLTRSLKPPNTPGIAGCGVRANISRRQNATQKYLAWWFGTRHYDA